MLLCLRAIDPLRGAKIKKYLQIACELALILLMLLSSLTDGIICASRPEISQNRNPT